MWQPCELLYTCYLLTYLHTHIHTPVSWPFVQDYPGEPVPVRYTSNLDFTEARDSEWQWHQLGRMQVCTSLQTDSHASTPPLSFLQARCSSCRPTNSVKALKASDKYNCSQKILGSEGTPRGKCRQYYTSHRYRERKFAENYNK